MLERKGARSVKDVPSAVLDALHNGDIPTVNLVECLAMDQRILLQNTLPKKYHKPLLDALDKLKATTYMNCIRGIGQTLFDLSQANGDAEIYPYLLQHPSDTVRCWATIFVGAQELNLADRLEAIKPLAADSHFGVREISWIAIRDLLMENPEEAIKLLTPWTLSEDENIRRFASESIRPKGVWCKQFKWIQAHPEAALPILDALKGDKARYVQDSVANWLNDLSKNNPSWVKDICHTWLLENPTSKETAYICKRALRSIED